MNTALYKIERINIDNYRAILEFLPLIDLLSCVAALRVTKFGELETNDQWWMSLFQTHGCNPIVIMGLRTYGYDKDTDIHNHSICNCFIHPCIQCRKRSLLPYYESILTRKDHKTPFNSRDLMIRLFLSNANLHVTDKPIHEFESDSDDRTEREIELEDQVQDLESDLYQVSLERDELEALIEDLRERCDELQEERDQLLQERD